MLTYLDIYSTYKNLIRKKLWNRLDKFDKAFVLSCLKLSKIKKIFNFEIINTFKNIISKIANFRSRMTEKGRKIAENAMTGSVAMILGKLRDWYHDSNYQFWLGLALTK